MTTAINFILVKLSEKEWHFIKATTTIKMIIIIIIIIITIIIIIIIITIIIIIIIIVIITNYKINWYKLILIKICKIFET